MAFSDSINAFVMDVRVCVTVSLQQLLLQTALKQFRFVLFLLSLLSCVCTCVFLLSTYLVPKYWFYWQSEDILESGAVKAGGNFRTVRGLLHGVRG